MPALPKNSPILFISPEESYFAELVTEGKSPELTNVTKIETPLIENGEIQAKALEAALLQLKVKTIHLVVSDAIFLHHIGDFPVNDKLSLEEHISNTIGTAFPDQSEPLHIVTLDLAKTSRIQTVQITATSKENLQKISDAIHASGVTLKNMVPASFVVKAFVSIDPSLFILESPTALLLTSHYIGVEHASIVKNADIDELSKQLSELKESHPHLQHAYLSLADESNDTLKNAVEEIIPTQPVSLPKVKAEADTPHALKALVLGYREIIENKFPFPEFEMPTSTAVASAENTESIPSVLEDEEEKESEDKTQAAVLPTPTLKKADIKEEKAEITKPEKPSEVEKKVDEDKDEEEDVVEDEKKEMKPDAEKSVSVKAAIPPVVAPKMVSPFVTAPVVTPTTATIPNTPSGTTVPTSTSTIPAPKITPTPVTANVDLTKQASIPSTTKVVKTKRNLFSYILLGTGIALVIALIGGGVVISQQALQGDSGFLANNQTEPTPVPAVEPTPSPTPTPTPEPIAKTDVNILVVNATSKAGYAGTTANALKSAGYTKVQTGNAKGTYSTPGTYVLVKDGEKMPGIVNQLQTDADLTLETMEYDTTEDAAGRYDVVIVLNE